MVKGSYGDSPSIVVGSSTEPLSKQIIPNCHNSIISFVTHQVGLVMQHRHMKSEYCVAKVSREKTFTNWWKYDIRGENFRRLLAFATPKGAMPQISWRKLSRRATKLKFAKVFSLESFPLYGILLVLSYIIYITLVLYLVSIVQPSSQTLVPMLPNKEARGRTWNETSLRH